MISFKAIILKFNSQGEKTGWSYIEIPSALAKKLYPNNKKSFRVKGKLDEHSIKGVSLLPMGEGAFIMALNGAMRKAVGKQKGASLQVQLEIDKIPYQLNKALMECLADEPAALSHFKSLPRSHQNYYSKWIDSAKTTTTKTKRIAMAVNAMLKKMDFGQMLRAAKEDDKLLRS